MFDKRRDNRDAGPAYAPTSTPTPAQPPPRPVEQPAPAPKAVIGPSVRIKGELSGDEDVLIAGEFEGTIDLSNQALRVVQGGQVRANVKANVIEIEGEVHGDVEGGDKVQITKSGRMQGNISSPRVILDDGAIFKGSVDMEPPKPAAKPRPAAAAAPAPSPAPAPSGSAASAPAGSGAKAASSAATSPQRVGNPS